MVSNLLLFINHVFHNGVRKSQDFHVLWSVSHYNRLVDGLSWREAPLKYQPFWRLSAITGSDTSSLGFLLIPKRMLLLSKLFRGIQVSILPSNVDFLFVEFQLFSKVQLDRKQYSGRDLLDLHLQHTNWAFPHTFESSRRKVHYWLTARVSFYWF